MTAPFMQLGATVLGVVDAYRCDSADFGPPYKPGSAAWRDHNAERRFVGAWSQMPMRNVHSEAIRYLNYAEEHLRGCGHLIPAEGVVFSPISLGRTVLNATAAAHWLLAPGVDASERIRRHMNVQLNALEEKLQHCGDDPESTQYKERVQGDIDKLTGAAEKAGMTPRKSRNWGRRYIDSVMPSDTQMLRELIAHADIPLPAEFLQRIHSAAVHANPNSLAVADLVPLEPSREGIGLAAVQMDLPKMAGLMLSPTYVFFHGVLAVFRYFGQPTSGFERSAFPHVRQLSALAVAANTPVACPSLSAGDSAPTRVPRPETTGRPFSAPTRAPRPTFGG